MANTRKQTRQISAAKRLDAQLESGVKPGNAKETAGKLNNPMVPLTDKDVERIKHERFILKQK
jgi:hypothetical protein